jgi:hypothetical protein
LIGPMAGMHSDYLMKGNLEFIYKVVLSCPALIHSINRFMNVVDT